MKRLIKNNKGFSLVELIAAVAILAVVVTPLLHSFVTSTNISRRTSEIAEATLACKNILEVADATSISNWQEISNNNVISNLLSSDLNNCSITPVGNFDSNGNLITDEEGGFTVALQNLKAGSNYYDAKVEFNRGDKDEKQKDESGNIIKDENGEELRSTSHGLYEINSEELAQYSGMDGVYCQSYTKTANPDYLVEDVYAQYAKTKPEVAPQYKSRTRTIQVETWMDNEGLVWAKLEYRYRFKYIKRMKDENGNYYTPSTGTEKTYTYSYSYSLLPGGFKPTAKDGSVSLYVMYYPDFNGLDTINFLNIAEDENHVKLNIFLYKQNPLEYDETSNEYVPVTMTNTYMPRLTVFMPQSYDLTQTDTLIYTNIKEGNTSLDFGVANGTYDVVDFDDPDVGHVYSFGYIHSYDDPIFDVVRMENTIRIYNVKITLYPANSVIINTHKDDEEDETVISSEASWPDSKPIYVVEGSKTQ